MHMPYGMCGHDSNPDPHFAKERQPGLWPDCLSLAEGAGFEPAWTFALTVFKTSPLNGL